MLFLALLSNRLSDKVQLHRFSTLHLALYFLRELESLVVLTDVLGVESNLDVEVSVGVHVALSWRDGEILAESFSIPREVSLDITEVAQLHRLGELTVDDDCSEGKSVLHEFELNTMCHSCH